MKLGRKIVEGCGEALHGRANDASSHLTNSREAMSDTGVDNGKETLAHHLANIDTYRSTPKVKGGELIEGMFSNRNIVHFQGVALSIGRSATDELDDGRRGCHSKGTNADGFGDGAI